MKRQFADLNVESSVEKNGDFSQQTPLNEPNQELNSIIMVLNGATVSATW